MKKVEKKTRRDNDELRPSYKRSDFGEGIRGKNFKRFGASSNLVLLAPEVRKAFPTDEAVDKALRYVMSAKELVK